MGASSTISSTIIAHPSPNAANPKNPASTLSTPSPVRLRSVTSAGPDATPAEVHVVAPATVQSAAGHGITLAVPLLTSRVTVEGLFTGVAVEGRPADCVKVAVARILPRQPDLVVSGMNMGANVGIN